MSFAVKQLTPGVEKWFIELVWAGLGAGSGTFSRALAALLGIGAAQPVWFTSE